MTWALVTALAVITESISVLLQRVLLHDDKSDPTAFAIASQMLMATMVALYAVTTNGFHLPDFTQYWFPIALTLGLYGVGHIMYAKTLQRMEASIFTVLLATGAVWVIIASYVLFGEHVTLIQGIGALCIFLSICLLVERTGKVRIGTDILMGLGTGLVFGLATVAYVYVGRNADVASWTALCPAGTALLILLFNPRSVQRMKPFLRPRILSKMLLLGVFFGICNLALLSAYARGNAALVAPLEKSSLILTVVLSIIFLRERNRLWQKTLAAGLCFIGVLLMI